MPNKTLPPIHPGEVLKEEFMEPLKLSINLLSRELHVAPNRIGQIVNRERAITADTALRLAAFFETTPEFWMNLQSLHDLDVARQEDALAIKRQVRSFRAESVPLARRSRILDEYGRSGVKNRG